MANNGEIFDGPKEVRPGQGYRKFRYCVRRGQGGRHRDIFVWIDEQADESIMASAGRAELQRTLDQGDTPMRIFIESHGETTWLASPWWVGRIISLTLVVLIGLAGGWLVKRIGHGALPSASAPLIGVGGAVVLIYALTTFMKLTVRSHFKYTRRQRLRTAPPLSAPESESRGLPRFTEDQ